MSSAAARAEARRKAILGRGGDRLAKLTTSARGEDASAFLRDGTPEPRRGSAMFVGEETNMPPPSPPPKETPRRLSHSPPAPAFDDQPNAPVWSEEQRQLMEALMGGALNPATFPPLQSQTSGPSFSPAPHTSSTTADDPFGTMMAQLAHVHPSAQSEATSRKVAVSPARTKTRTRLQKWLPLLHLACMWSLLAFFVLWKEPEVFVEKTAGAIEVVFWKRWPKLVTHGKLEGVWGVQVVPFFWAFITLQVMLHSLRIFSGHDEVQPPALLSFALPHLPPPLPSMIMNGLRYLRMGSSFIDDVLAIVFGVGVTILITTWFAD